MPQRSDAEWRELVRRLKAVANDPEEERSRRQRALAILETVPRQYLSSPSPSLSSLDYLPDFDGSIR